MEFHLILIGMAFPVVKTDIISVIFQCNSIAVLYVKSFLVFFSFTSIPVKENPVTTIYELISGSVQWNYMLFQ